MELNLESVKNFLETNEEGKRWLQSYTDNKITKGIETWKTNNLQSEVDKKVKELYPDEDPKDKALKQLKLEFEKLKQDTAKKEILSQASKIAAEKKLPMEIVQLLVADDLDTTNSNIKILEDIWTKSLKESIKSKVEPYTPTSGNSHEVTKESFINMSYQDKKQLKKENPDLYNSLIIK